MFNIALSIISLFYIVMGSIVLFNMTLGNCLMDDIVHVSIKLYIILGNNALYNFFILF